MLVNIYFMRAKIRYMREKTAGKWHKMHANLSQRTHFNAHPTIFHGFSTSRRLVWETNDGSLRKRMIISETNAHEFKLI